MLSLLARLGVVLYWLGCLLAILAPGTCRYAFMGQSKLPGGRVCRRGRCRVLAGWTGVLVRSGRQMIGLIWPRQNDTTCCPDAGGDLALTNATPSLAHSEPGYQGATYPVASGLGDPPPVAPHTDVGGPGVLADPGPFPRFTGAGLRSSACRHELLSFRAHRRL